MDLADVVRRHGPAYLARFGTSLQPEQRAALAAILRCHTPACGGGLYGCPHCARKHFVYHRCGHRACGQCGQAQRLRWQSHQQERLLPVPYFLVTFTVPKELRIFFHRQPKTGYRMLLQESAAALQDVAQLDRHLGGELGFLAVLHTWTRQLIFHPHVHILVPGVAQRRDGSLSFPKDGAWLCSVRRLSARFRHRLQQRLRQQAPQWLAHLPAHLWRQPWVVHCQSAGRGREALNYLSRYLYKTALSSAALVSQDDSSVSFRYQDRASAQSRICRLPAEKFLHRFLQHVLPKGFHRVRYFGWLSPASKARFALLAGLLGAAEPADSTTDTSGSKGAISGPASTSVCCPDCGHAMVLLARLPRAPP
jgi:hypothetical protein